MDACTIVCVCMYICTYEFIDVICTCMLVHVKTRKKHAYYTKVWDKAKSENEKIRELGIFKVSCSKTNRQEGCAVHCEEYSGGRDEGHKTWIGVKYTGIYFPFTSQNALAKAEILINMKRHIVAN